MTNKIYSKQTYDMCQATIKVQLATIATLEKQLAAARGWIKNHPPQHPDHACSLCIDSESNKDGYICQYHKAMEESR